jgi:hypothetical protein
MAPFTAIWDTGATASVITQAVVTACGLISTGMTNVFHAQGMSQAQTFLVNIRLPNGVLFHGIRVTQGDLTGADMLIGMDVIGVGDFAVTQPNGRTKFSFRVPSQADIDFVEEDTRLDAG